MAKTNATSQWATHTATLVVSSEFGKTKTRTVRVRVTPTRIEDEGGRLYSKKGGYQIVPRRLMGYSTYSRKLDLESLKPIELTHADHPIRHWDRSCPACIASKAEEAAN